MKTLFSDITLLFEDGHFQKNAYLAVEGKRICYIGTTRPEGAFDRVIDGTGKLLCPGFYNCHAHSAMTLFRGYAEDLPLDRWLHEKIFPAEDLLHPHAVYAASMLAIAEMISVGTVSFSDMYFFCDETARAVAESGIKANISRSCVAFDKAIRAENDERFQESVKLFEAYHNTADGRIKIDMSIHAEYTTVAESCRYIAAFAKEKGTGIQLHLSETAAEHQASIGRHGMTPAQFFAENGVFDVPVTAAHCVYATHEDRVLMQKYGVTAVHNPASNLKLGSGVMPLADFLEDHVRVTLGTDGAASNNALDIWKEAYLSAILQKGMTGNTERLKSAEFVKMLTKNGAEMQGREDCGMLSVGAKADLVMIDVDTYPAMPMYSPCDTFLYSANSTCVRMTMADGVVLYENGEFLTLDIEKVRRDFKDVVASYFK